MHSKRELNTTLMHCMMARNGQNLETWQAWKMSLRCPDVEMSDSTPNSVHWDLSFLFPIRNEILNIVLDYFVISVGVKVVPLIEMLLNWLNIFYRYHTPFKVYYSMLKCPYRQNFYFLIWFYISPNELLRKKNLIWIKCNIF